MANHWSKPLLTFLILSKHFRRFAQYWQKVSALKEKLILLGWVPKSAINRAERTLLDLRETWESTSMEVRSPRLSDIEDKMAGNESACYKRVQRFLQGQDLHEALKMLLNEETDFVIGDPTEIERPHANQVEREASVGQRLRHEGTPQRTDPSIQYLIARKFNILCILKLPEHLLEQFR